MMHMDEASPEYSRIMSYIDRNPAAVLSTTGDDNKPHGAVVYVCTASHHTVCFVTKNGTAKYKNLMAHPDVAVTFLNEKESSTLQATGRAFVVDDQQMINYVLDKITALHTDKQVDWLPPISKLQAGDYVAIGVELATARLAEYQGNNIDSKQIFTELK
jgi:uncharacterized pyridoxamine 5'-phosphate oxidase family protein